MPGFAMHISAAVDRGEPLVSTGLGASSSVIGLAVRRQMQRGQQLQTGTAQLWQRAGCGLAYWGTSNRQDLQYQRCGARELSSLPHPNSSTGIVHLSPHL